MNGQHTAVLIVSMPSAFTLRKSLSANSLCRLISSMLSRVPERFRCDEHSNPACRKLRNNWCDDGNKSLHGDITIQATTACVT